MSQSEQDLRLDYIEFPATDVALTRAFYEQVFGWKFQDFGPDYAAIDDGRLTGGFRTGAAPPGGGTLAVIYAVDLDAVKEKIVAAGGKIIRPTFAFPGGRRFHFKDPGGNELSVWTDQGL